MQKEEIIHIFESGIQQFNVGKPMPEDRCEAMGWRFARDMAREKELRLENAFDTFLKPDQEEHPPSQNQLDGAYYVLIARRKFGSDDIFIGYVAAKYSKFGGYIEFSKIDLGSSKFHSRMKHWKETPSNYTRATKFLNAEKAKNKLQQIPNGCFPDVGICYVENGLIVKVI